MNPGRATARSLGARIGGTVGVHTYGRHSLLGFFIATLVIAQLAAAVGGVDAASLLPVDAACHP